MKRNTFEAPPVEADFELFANTLCEADRKELATIAGIKKKDLKEALTGYFRSSFECYTLVDNESLRPIALFGCVSKEMEYEAEGTNKLVVGHPWLLSNGDLELYPKEVMQLAKYYIKERWAPYFSYLHVMASENHPYSIPFLKKIGFKQDTQVNLPHIKGTVLIYV